MAPRKILLILDLNGALLDMEFVGNKKERRDELLADGHLCDGGIGFFPRLGLHDFLSGCPDLFGVAIWTCGEEKKTSSNMNAIFTPE